MLMSDLIVGDSTLDEAIGFRERDQFEDDENDEDEDDEEWHD